MTNKNKLLSSYIVDKNKLWEWFVVGWRLSLVVCVLSVVSIAATEGAFG